MYTYAKFKVHPGKLDEFKALAREACRIVKEREPGTILYEWFFNPDETECVAIDGYVDLDAVMAHVQNIAPIMRQLMSISDRYLEMYGADPTERFGGKTTAKLNEYYGPFFAGKLD